MSKSAAAAVTPELEHLEAEIDEIDRSHNYRKTFPKEEIDEMAASITAKGVIQPIVIRPAPPTHTFPWLLVIGERRVRGSIAAGKTTIPAIVRRDLDDATARALSLIENLQRRNVPPLEEADGFYELRHKLNHTAEQIAEQTGQKVGYVYARLKLAELEGGARKLFTDGTIDLSAAILIARMPTKEQQKALVAELKKWHAEQIGYHQVRRLIDEKYMRLLGSAPFDVKDDKLVAGAGACAACPKRTGNQRELFADLKSDDVCTDPVCYMAKSDATWKKQAAAAEEKGVKVLSAAETKNLFPYSNELSYGSAYVEASAKCYEDKKERTYNSILGKDAPIVLARDPVGGVHKLIAKKELAPLLKAAGVTTRPSSSGYSAKQRAAEAASRKKQLRARRVTKEVLGGIVTAFEELPTADLGNANLWMRILEMLVDGGYHDAIKEVCGRREWKEKGKQEKNIITAKAKAMTGPQLRALALEVLIARGAYWLSYATAIPKHVVSCADTLGVNVKAIEKRIADEDKAKEKAKGKKSAKKGGRK